MQRGEMFQQSGWSDKSKLEYAMQINNELNDFYQTLSQMVIIALDRELKMVIENPYTQPHYLTERWCIKPKFVDKDRTQRGDHFKKPTQYYFINCDPEHNFVCEALATNEVYTIDNAHKIKNGYSRQTNRSMIAPEYANRFIREQILDEEEHNG